MRAELKVSDRRMGVHRTLTKLCLAAIAAVTLSGCYYYPYPYRYGYGPGYYAPRPVVVGPGPGYYRPYY